ncbi:MAG: acyltransferase, partial [Solirubrobacteraceae bacterium]|nr:acyltransferase [Solirubrobacteraceae bacterium]
TIGARVRIQSQVYVTAGTVVEDDVFIGPGASTTNDNAVGRPASGEALRGPRIERGARVGGSVTLTPGVVIGAEAFIGAGSVVTRDIPAGARAYGVPARVVGEVPTQDRLGD